MKKKLMLLFILFTMDASAQTPIALFPDIQVSQVKFVANNVTRLCYSTLDASFYYSTYDGNIYRVTPSGTPDTLLYTINDHALQTCQGMVMYDSTIFIAGNNDVDSAYTTGYIMRGQLQANGTRLWSVQAATEPYPTAGQFDHHLSGLYLNKTNDTLYLCNGSRGDHGEVRDNNGLFPNARLFAINASIFQIPIANPGLIIPNDSAALDAQQLIFARGIRNTYDFAYNAEGDLFGAENSGDRDHEDELNFLQQGHHYGFPWIMGGTDNPQQHSWFNPAADLLINHNSGSWNQGAFTNDPAYPQKPAGLIFDLPCLNIGPDAAYMRDSITGTTYNAAALSQGIYSFTPHRSPLGLAFDTDSSFGGMYRGNGFVLSYTRGDSTLAGFSKLLSPFNDHSEDMQLLQMTKDVNNQTYSFTSTRIVSNFSHPIDAVILDTSIYVIEIGYANTSSLWRIDFPKALSSSLSENDNANIRVYPNPFTDHLQIEFNKSYSNNSIVKIFDVTGRCVDEKFINASNSMATLSMSALSSGTYILQIQMGDDLVRRKVMKW